MISNKIVAILFFVVWIVLAGGFYTIAYFATGQVDLQYLANAGIHTKGKVLAKQPGNHNAIVYTYKVNGIDYTGSGRAGDGNPQFDQLKAGDEISVVYDPENNLVSVPGDPSPLVEANNRLILKVAIIGSSIPISLIAVAYFLYRRAVGSTRAEG